MKNLWFVLVVVFSLATFVGCNKKKNEATDLNNVVSLDNSSNAIDTNAVPVVEENAALAVSPTTENAIEKTDVNAADTTGKPTPKMIQQALKNAGLYNGKVDGNIGPMTKKAVEAFQSQNNLKADGKVGRHTWKLLSPYLNKSTEVANPSADSQAVAQ